MCWSRLEGKKQRGDITTVIHHLWRVGEKVEPDFLKAHSKRQQVAAREVLVRKKNVHHGDGKALEPVHGEAVGTLPWEVLMAELDQPSAI